MQHKSAQETEINLKSQNHQEKRNGKEHTRLCGSVNVTCSRIEQLHYESKSKSRYNRNPWFLLLLDIFLQN